MQHTHGPWAVNFKKFSEVRAENGAIVAECKKLTGLVNLQANARLIAAAPELLECLRAVLDEHPGTENARTVKAMAAIAKAVGAA